MHQFDAVVVTSEDDRSALLKLANRAHGRFGGPEFRSAADRLRVTVVPNGVDTERFTPPRGEQRHADTIVFTGKLSYHANIAAAKYLIEDIMPLVWGGHPDANVVLAGANPVRSIRALARRNPERVRITGYVEDLGAEIGSAVVAAAPIVYGVGIQNKVLEALATATPVVATPAAVRGIPGTPEGVVVADGPSAFASALVRLLQNPDKASALGAAGRAYVEQHCTWESSVAKLEEVYQIAIERGRARLAAEGAAR